jgi:hypothetical protein
MYQFPGYKGSQSEDEERTRRISMANTSQQSPLVARSPSIPQYNPPYSPTSNAHARPTFNSQYHPPTPAPLPIPSSIGPPVRPPPSPTSYDLPSINGSAYRPQHAREKSTSTYYDPTSDHGDSNQVRNRSQYSGSPTQTQQVCPPVSCSQTDGLSVHHLNLEANMSLPCRAEKDMPMQRIPTSLHCTTELINH